MMHHGYKVGKWYSKDGGVLPLHPKDKVRYVWAGCFTDSVYDEVREAEKFEAQDGAPFLFKIVEVYKVSKPSINWDHVSSTFNYLAKDECGVHYLYSDKPRSLDYTWEANGVYAQCRNFASFVEGDCNWKDSLVCRNNNGE